MEYEELDNIDIMRRNIQHIDFNIECVSETIAELEQHIKQAQKEGKTDAVMQYGQSLRYAQKNLETFKEAKRRARVKYMEETYRDEKLNTFLNSLGILLTDEQPEVKTTISMN